jgi:carbon storage regulator
MLVLERKKGQSFMIGEDICITILDHIGEYSRVSISAPRSVPILRTELLERSYGSGREPSGNRKVRR